MDESTETRNLRLISQQSNYLRWIYDTIHPYLHGRILEIGAGMGTFTALLENEGYEVFPIDKRAYVDTKSRTEISICDIASLEGKMPPQCESLICLNVLEHIHDDETAFGNMVSFIAPGGNVVLMVPSHPFLYGSMDSANNHYRRYRKEEIISMCKRHDLAIRRIRYMNIAGLLGWFYHSRIRHTKVHCEKELERFDRMVPFIRRVESLLPVPAGLSLVVVAQR